MLKIVIRYMAMFSVCWGSALAWADTTDDPRVLQHQRKLFPKAEAVAHKPQSWDYTYLQGQLDGYPLAPYIELKTLMNFPFMSNKDKIATFLQKYEDTPLDRPLRSKWLSYLAEKNQQALFLHFYRDIGNPALTCKKIQYQLARKDLREQALSEVPELWLTGESQPKECDVVFEQWQDAGLRTEEMIWKRLVLAGSEGQHTLVGYLSRQLPSEQQYLGDLWLKVRRSPSYVSRLSYFPGKFPRREAEILAYGLHRLVWSDPELALRMWEQINKRYTFNGTEQQDISTQFALALAIDDDPRAELWLERAVELGDDEQVLRWHLANGLRKQDWPHVIEVAEEGEQRIGADLYFQYWLARSYAALKSDEAASQSFGSLAEQRHYYGFMASAQLATAPQLADKPLDFEPVQLLAVANHPAAKRAYEFLQLKRYASARREWIYLQSTLDDQQNLMAAVLADSWGWHDQAIFTLSRTGYLDDVKRRFPLAYSEYLVPSAEQNNVDPAFAFAIARRESSFMADAASGAGARGLMQLLPSTARYMAKKKVSYSSLFDPEQNVQYGTQYLRYLLDKVSDNPVLATASYNAGWRKVKRWLPESGSVPMDIWVETIPYRETRNYVKAVLAYQQIYAYQLGRNKNLFTDFAKMNITSAGLAF